MPVRPENSISNKLDIRDCGQADYKSILDMQLDLVKKRKCDEICDTVLMVEHPAVITRGARQSANRFISDVDFICEQGIQIVDVRRGGGATAHNPGQLVFYPVMKLANCGVNQYIRQLESIGIELLKELGVVSCRKKGFPGLWIQEKKIASVGVRVSKSVTYHGMAINIYNDLEIFSHIVPCGLDGVEVTSVYKETGIEKSMQRTKNILKKLLLKFLSNGAGA